MIRARCDRKRAAHQCCGGVTITRNAITLQCPLCGDLRQVLEPTERAANRSGTRKRTFSETADIGGTLADVLSGGER
jgi:hypothetical protein